MPGVYYSILYSLRRAGTDSQHAKELFQVLMALSTPLTRATWQRSKCRIPAALVLAATVLTSSMIVPVNALPEDNQQPIHITADKALRDEKKGLTIYVGSVRMRQGSMELEADKLTIYHNTEDADKIIARGKPAKMRQRPEVDSELVHAEAISISFFRREDRVHLKTDARIEQDGALVTGNSIDYFIGKQLVRAQSGKTSDGKRVSVVIPPNLQGAGAAPNTPTTDNNTDTVADKAAEKGISKDDTASGAASGD